MSSRARAVLALVFLVLTMVTALCLELPHGPISAAALQASGDLYGVALAAPSPSATPTPTTAQICSPRREAEHGVIQPPMVVGSDPDASNGQYVYSPVPYEGELILDSGQGPGAYYYLWGRVAGDCDGSYPVQVVLGQSNVTVQIPCGPWSWQRLRVSSFWWGSPRAITVRVGSANARLDVFELRADTLPPSTPTPGPPCQETVLLQQGSGGYSGCTDTYLYEYAPDTNYCLEETLRVGRHQQEASLIQFDLTSVPSDTVLTGAQLQLYAQSWGGSGLVMDVLRVVRDVNMCQATWNQAGEGNPWTLPGCNDTTGDRDAVPVGSIAADEILKWYYVNVTSLVQGWVDGAVPNNGLLIRQSTFPETNSFYFASAQNSDSTHRPKLVLSYWTTPPMPTPTPTPTPIPTGLVTVGLQQGSNGYQGCEDTYIYEYAPNANYCTSNLIQVGYHQWNEGLIRFDVDSVASSAIVSEAALQVYAAGWDETDMGIDAFYITSTVRYCEATWNQYQAFVNWGSPGCNNTGTDRRAIPESTVMTSGFHKWYSFDLTDVVQGWVNGSLANNGVLLRASAYPYTGPFQFYSAQEGFTQWRPKLVITYSLPSATPTATATPTPTSSPVPTHTLTATPPGDLTLSGRVYNAALGPQYGVSRATVSAIMCMPRSFQTLSEADGSYSMLLPSLYLNQCMTITLEATGGGYQTLSFEIPVADLRAQPVRDLALIALPTPMPTATPILTPTQFRVWIPIIIKATGLAMSRE